MKTTVEIADPLLHQARALAAREGVTLRTVIERGLRQVVVEAERKPAFKLRDASFQGRGLRPELRNADWDRLRDLAYDGRGA